MIEQETSSFLNLQTWIETITFFILVPGSQLVMKGFLNKQLLVSQR